MVDQNQFFSSLLGYRPIRKGRTRKNLLVFS